MNRVIASNVILGGGAFGVVYRGAWADGSAVAVKAMPANKREWAWREAQILQRLNHPNLLKLRGVLFRDDGQSYLVTELAVAGTYAEHLLGARRTRNGALVHVAQPPPPLTQQQRVAILRGMVSGLECLHSQLPDRLTILHR